MAYRCFGSRSLTAAEWVVVAQTCVTLPCAAIAVRMARLPTAVRLVAGSRRSHVKPHASIPPARLAAIVRGVAVRLGFRCLPQALTLHRLLIRRGFDSDVRVGAELRSRFQAHAWVQHDGRSLLGPAVGAMPEIWRASSARTQAGVSR
jgi:hypothetical protein